MMADRLNPKLTKRNLAINLPLGDDSITTLSSKLSSEASDTHRSGQTSSSEVTTSTESKQDAAQEHFLQMPKNPRLHLIHNGKWIPRQYNCGRKVERTGLWDCCGHPEHYSIYCDSLDQRVKYEKEVEDERQRKLNAFNAREARKMVLYSQIQIIENNPIEFHNFENDHSLKIKADKKKLSSILGTGQSDSSDIASQVSLAEKANAKCDSDDLNRINQAAFNSTLNAPMLMQFLLRRFNEEPTVAHGLEYVIHHIHDNGQGCLIFYRHNILPLLLKVYETHTKNKQILLLVITIVKYLLDCNLTRDQIMDYSPDSATIGITNDDGENEQSSLEMARNLFQMIFHILYLHMNSLEHVENATRALMQCTRYEYCREMIVNQSVVPYLVIITKKYMKTSTVYLYAFLKICHWLCVTKAYTSYLVEKVKVLPYIIKCMKFHLRDRSILIPVIVLLHHVIGHIPKMIDPLIDMMLPKLLVDGLELLYDKEEIQYEGLKLLQTISKTSKGWKELSAISGAWQKITQGTEVGDALVHDLPGDFQNPGWVLGEAPYLPRLERMKLEAVEINKNSLDAAPKAAWTAPALREYMGLSMSGQSLSINTEYHDVYFGLLGTLDMLPQVGEERESWYARLRHFEKENDVRLEEMVYTVQEMKKRDAIQKKMASQRIAMSRVGGEGLGMTVKDVYVQGQKIDGRFLAENDIDLNEALYSKI